MRIPLSALATLGSLVLAFDAQAQIPGMPDLPGLGGDVEAPSFRVAASDTLKDRAAALEGRIKDTKEQLSDSEEDERARSVLTDASDAVSRTKELLKGDGDAVPAEIELGDVVGRFESAMAAHREMRAARRAQELQMHIAPGAQTSLATAKELRASAATLLAQARAQSAEAGAKTAAQRLVVDPAAIERAADVLERANDRFDEALQRWRERGTTENGRTPVEDARFYLAEARRDAALARVETLAYLYQPDARAAPPRYDVDGRIAEAKQLRSATQVLLDTGGTDVEDPSQLETRKAILNDAVAELRTIEALDRLIRAREPKRVGETPWTRWALTGLLLLACVILLVAGQKIVHVLLGVRGTVSNRLGLSKRASTKIDVLLTLGWYSLVLVAAMVVALWGVWQVEISVANLLDYLRHPLLLIEGHEVSAMSIVQLLVSLVVAFFVSRGIRRFLEGRIYSALDWDKGLSNAVSTIIHYLVIVAGGMVGLRFVGIGLSSLALFAGVLGIGIGFGLRNIVENFISGLILLAERPIQVGDFVHLDGGLEGQVRHIRARSTTVRTRDNVSVIVPNSHFVGSSVTNWSHGDPKVRIEIEVGIAYGSNVDLARKTMMSVAENHGQVLSKPPPVVYFRAFGDSSLNFSLLAWIRDPDYRFRIASDLHFAVDAAFRRSGVEIAYPQIDLHLRSLSDGVLEQLRRVNNPTDDLERNPGKTHGDDEEGSDKAGDGDGDGDGDSEKSDDDSQEDAQGEDTDSSDDSSSKDGAKAS